jgi:hypothetical protein
LGVAGRDVTGQDVTGQDVTGQDVAGQDTCRPVGTDRGLGWRRVLSLATSGTEWDAKPDVTRVVSRVNGWEGLEGMDVARKAESPKEIQSSDKSEHSIVPIGYLI